MYRKIERIFERFVPLFNHVLSHPRLSWKGVTTNRVKVNMYNLYQKGNWDQDRPIVNPPKVSEKFVPVEMKDVSLEGRNVQVIVKMANIHLTPEKPKYEGGVWHLEGMANEGIVATGIYYYETENITDSFLNFRQACREPNYEQSDDRGVEFVYNLENEGPLIQEIGAVATIQDRCIAFPNVIQHRVGSFELKDKTKNGHRKILGGIFIFCFFFLLFFFFKFFFSLIPQFVSSQPRLLCHNREDGQSVNSTFYLGKRYPQK